MKRVIDAMIRKVSNSYVITVPIETIKKFKLKQGDYIEVEFKIK
ncbi:MAG: AbrB/MazE/SpoVT family DNA-binding domain-containing protein [Nanoarchaeota archaeon]